MKILNVLALLLLCSFIQITHAENRILNNHIKYNNKELQFAYYLPKNVSKNTMAIVLVNGLNGPGEGMITEKWITFADRKNMPIIAPSFVFEGETAFQKEQSYQYPKTWSGPAFNEIIKSFMKQGINIKQLNMFGFSAGAQFVQRYSLLYPKKVAKSAIYASGGNDPLTKKLPVKFFYGIGLEDQQNRKTFAKQFKAQAKKTKTSLIYREYPNTGHNLTDQVIDDVIEFFNQ